MSFILLIQQHPRSHVNANQAVLIRLRKITGYNVAQTMFWRKINITCFALSHSICQFMHYDSSRLKCFDAVGWAAGRASGL